MTKKFFIILLVLMLLTLFVSCSSDMENTGTTAAPTGTPEEDKTPAETTIDMRVMSFNLRYTDFITERIDLVIKMIETYKPDSVGFQEATGAWVALLAERLGDEYAYVSCGRNEDNTGEASSIFYLKSRFKEVESGTKWMSNTPDVAGSKLPESSNPRIFTYVVLEEKETHKSFVHVNTHLEHTSEDARVAQVEILLNYISRFDDSKIPCVLTGDFNCTAGSRSYNQVIAYGLVNSSTIAKKVHEGETYHGYGTTSSIIDFIFVSNAHISVDFYRVCNEVFLSETGKILYPSDHNPVIADIKIGEKI